MTSLEKVRTLKKWNIKAGKAMFVIKTTIEEDLLVHIKDKKYAKRNMGHFGLTILK